MPWEENRSAEEYVVPDTVVDALFSISCRNLPVDHAYALSHAVQRALPWFADEADAGLYMLHIAGSGNGWQRADEPGALLQLSRRTKLALRIPKQRIADARRLLDQTLDVAGHAMRIEGFALRPLSRITTLFSHCVAVAAGDDEPLFLTSAGEQLEELGIRPARMLCGLATSIAMPAHTLHTRSLMIADLSIEESVLLQQRGLGSQRILGCGLFLPHKDINEVRRRQD